jgi:autotransporter-associated beta strand protein
MWSNATPDSATFANTAGTVSLGTAITASSVSLNSNGYIIDLNGFDFTVTGSTGGTAPAISSTTVTNTSGTTATFNTAGFGSNSGPLLSGNMNVSYTGGAWNPVLNHDFTGTLSLLGTGLVRSDGVDLGSNSNASLLRLGGTHTLQLGTTGNIQYRTYARSIELLTDVSGSPAITAGGLRTLTLSGNITGTGRLKVGSSQGAYVLAGNNSYSGLTFITGAGLSLIAASDTAFGNSTIVETRSATSAEGGSVTASTIGFQGNVNIGSTAKLVFSGGAPGNGLGSLHNFGGDNTFAGNIELGSNIPRPFAAEANSSLLLMGVISQARGILKFGEGTIALSGVNNYGTSTTASQAGTTINQGTLRLDFSQAGAPTDDIINNGLTVTGATGSSQLILGGGALEIKGKAGATNSQRFKNNASNGFTINAGASSVTAVQDAGNPGTLTVNLGRLSARNVGGTVNFTLPSSGSIVLPTTGTASTILTSNGTAFATVGGNDWAAKDASNNAIVAGSSIGGFYTANTAGTLSGNADMSGSVDTVLGADVAITSLRFNSAGARTVTATGQTLTTGGILVTAAVGNNVSTITGGTLIGASGAANQDLVIFQNNSSAALTIDSVIANNVTATGLTKSGSGVLNLTNANTYSGTTTANQGVLKLSNATALPGGIAAAGGTSGLTINGGVIGLTAASGNFSRALGTGVAQVQFLANGGGFAAYGGDREVNIGGAGTPSAVNWGNTASFLPTGAPLILSASDADGTLIFRNLIGTLSSASSPISRYVEVRDGSAAVDARLVGVVSAQGGFVKTGPGTLEMSAVNTFTGNTEVNGGSLLVTGSLHTDTPIFVNNGSTLRQGANGVTGGHFITVNSGTLDLAGFNATARSLTLGSGPIGTTSTVSTDAGTLTLAGNVTYNGNANNANGASITGNLALGTTTRTFQVNDSTAASNDLTVSALISGSGGVTKTGAGTLNLSNASNTYGGPTTVSAGTLLLTGSVSSTSSVAVNTGGTLLLGAADRINNSAAINLAGGILNTGGFGETVGALTLSDSSTIDLGKGASVLTFGAGTMFAGSQVLTIDNWSGNSEGHGTDQLIFSQDMSSSLSQISFTGFGGAAQIDLNNGQYEIVPVPEPATLFAALALLGLIGCREGRRLRGSRG